MELKIINEQGQAASTLQASDAVFGREYNEALVHQLVVAFQANARSGNRKQKGRSEIAKSTRKPWGQKGTGRARAGMASSPLWRGGGKIFPSSPDENFSHKVNRKMYRAGMASILSHLAREDRIAVVDGLAVEAPKTKLFAQKIKGMGYDHVLVVTDALDENLFLASRNLPNVLVLEAQETDPVSLIRYPKVLVTKNAVAKFEGDVGMSTVNQERLLQVLLAPQISEKATYIADKNEQVVFKVAPDASKPEIKAAVELLFKVQVESVQVANVKGKVKRHGRFVGRRNGFKKAFVCLKPGQEINLSKGAV